MTPTIPTRAVVHRGLRRTVTRAIPARVGLTVKRAMPCAFVRRVTLIPGAVSRTWARTNGRPFVSRTRAVIVDRVPTLS